jgi:hypothetical protein
MQVVSVLLPFLLHVGVCTSEEAELVGGSITLL